MSRLFLLVLLCAFGALLGGAVQQTREDQGRLKAISSRHFQSLQRPETLRLLAGSRKFLADNGMNFSALRREHTCEHDAYMARSGIASTYSREGRKKISSLLVEHFAEKHEKRQVTKEPIRVHMDTTRVSSTDALSCQTAGSQVTMEDGLRYTCTSNDVLTAGKIAIISNVMNAIRDALLQMIQVTPVANNLILPSTWFDNYALGYNCRANLPIPSTLTSTGTANADYYMFVIARPLGSTGVLANAAPCAHNILSGGVLDRPLAGSINFNPGSDLLNSLVADPTNPFIYDQVFKTGLHEVTHALGFTGSLYGDYRTPSGGLYSPVQNGAYGPAKTFARASAPYSLYWMTSPRVQAYARALFNCSTLGGMELEEADPQPSQSRGPGSHWEKRLVGNEYMSPVASPAMIVSKLTLSLFEDMGWYSVNYTYADPSYWGSQAGCAFATEECTATTWGRYFCSTQCRVSSCNSGVCNGDRSAVGYCDAVRYSQSLPPYYQHFTDPTLGGSSKWADYCPTIVGYSDRFCKDSAAQADIQSKGYGEAHTGIAACFDVYVQGNGDAGCFERQCTTDANGNKVLKVKVGNNQYDCVDNGPITVSAPVGTFTLNCPPVEFFCADNLVKSGLPVNWTYNPADSVPLPKDPFGGPAGTTDPNLELKWGSTLVWVLLVLGIVIAAVVVIAVCCMCCRGKSDPQ